MPVTSLGPSANALPLLLAGPAGCGKSTYLAALLQSIRQNMSKVYGCALYTPREEDTPAGNDPLCGEDVCPSENAPEPLAYSLIFSGEKPAGNTCAPVFHDPGGDAFQSEGAVAGIPALPHAKGILLFVDPFGLPGAREQLCLEGPPPPEQDPTAVLTRIIHALRLSCGPEDPQCGIGVPLAVCLAKLDLIAELLDRSSFVRHPTRHLREASFDKTDWRICDLEVQSLVESWGGGELLSQVRAHFSHHSFFGVGALGVQPKDNCVTDAAPHRVLDPFLWMLWRHKVIHHAT